jgi:hypothetical protein
MAERARTAGCSNTHDKEKSLWKLEREKLESFKD